MGRLTEYFGKGYSAGSNRNGDVVITGADDVVEKFSSIMMSDPNMERAVRKLIRKELQKARTATSKDIHSNLENDPRKTYKAVLHTVYKKVFGGNIKILSKRRRSSPSNYVKPRKLVQGQRGGNRRKVSERTKQLESYGSSDRGFILRFLNAGTDIRDTKYGNRGSITARHLFSRIAPWHMDTMANNVTEGLKQLINTKANG